MAENVNSHIIESLSKPADLDILGNPSRNPPKGNVRARHLQGNLMRSPGAAVHAKS